MIVTCVGAIGGEAAAFVTRSTLFVAWSDWLLRRSRFLGATILGTTVVVVLFIYALVPWARLMMQYLAPTTLALLYLVIAFNTYVYWFPASTRAWWRSWIL